MFNFKVDCGGLNKSIRGRNNVQSSDMTDHIIVMTGQNIASEMLSGHFTNDKYL